MSYHDDDPTHKHAQTLLCAQNISHSFDYQLFDAINFELIQGESVAIIGKSGTGKSTLLNILSSLLPPNLGDVYFQSTNLYQSKQKKLLEIRREDFGIIFQAHYLFRGFNTNENLHIAKLLSGFDVDLELLKALGIQNLLHQGVGELSGGQQQRLSIARVLTKKPQVIFADEPTGNLDKQTAYEVIDVLFEYIQKNRAGLIIVTHEQELAYKCDRVYEIEDLGLKRLQ